MRRGTRVGQAYVAITADGSGINDEIADAVDGAGPEIEKSGEEHGEQYGERFSGGFLDRLRARLPNIQDALAKSLSKGSEGDGAEVGDRLGAQIGGHVIDALNFALSKEGGENPLSQLAERFMRDSSDDMERAGARLGDRLGESISEALGDRMESAIAGIADAIDNIDLSGVSGNRGAGIGSDEQGIGDRFGALFGAGSRNNVLNLLGRSIGNIINLTTQAGEAAASMGKTFTTGFAAAASNGDALVGVLGGISAVGSRIGAGFSSMLASAPALAASLAVVLGVMSALASVMGALVALATALASTIASALVGAFAVGGGAILAMVAAGGLLTAAFMSMTDAQKTLLSDAFQPLKAEMVGLGQLMIREMVPAFAVWSENLQRALLLAAPLASVMGQAFARAGTVLTESLSGPGFQRVAAALGVWLPSIVTRLSQAFGGFLNGIAGMFAAVLPLVNRFAGYLVGVAQNFSRWANSTEGQNAIVDFTERAVAALKSLWGFVVQFTGFIGDVLFSRQAQNAGNTIFDALGDAFEKARKKINQWIKNGDLQKWFEDAIEFGASLWSVIKALADTFVALYNSGVLKGVGKAFEALAEVMNILNALITPSIEMFGRALPSAMAVIVGPLEAVANGVLKIGEAVQWVQNLIGQGSLSGGDKGFNEESWNNLSGLGGGFTLPELPEFTIPDLTNLGNNALNNTSVDAGGYMPEPEWKNPWKKWAESLIKDGPGAAAQVRKALRSLHMSIRGALRDAARLTTRADVRDAMAGLADSIDAAAKNMVDTAQQALNSAASSLAGASSPQEAQRALREVKEAQKALREAEKQQRLLERLEKRFRKQGISKDRRVNRLMRGLDVENATLADYAVARGRVAQKLERATQKLQDAISLRENYQSQVTDMIKSFGSLAGAQAQVLDGIEQALTSGDIVSHLKDRLKQIKEFQSDLRELLALGLSNEAYQQIVDMGVEEGSAFADALLQGGLGDIQQVNNLTGQISGIADKMGVEISNRMYQAGVDAARGLVNGLTSLSNELDRAATRLGNSIAAAVKRALGIKSPSTVMLAAMEDVGDGMVLGLNNQHVKVSTAAASLAGEIAVSPEAAIAAGQQTATDVSGNEDGQKFRDLVVITPTEDPHAVAMETLNEVTGRI